jgi:hypothetical protein
MSIAPVGGVGHVATFTSVGAVQRPESTEVPGAPDHDGDSDDAGTKTAQPSSRSVDCTPEAAAPGLAVHTASRADRCSERGRLTYLLSGVDREEVAVVR